MSTSNDDEVQANASRAKKGVAFETSGSRQQSGLKENIKSEVETGSKLNPSSSNAGEIARPGSVDDEKGPKTMSQADQSGVDKEDTTTYESIQVPEGDSKFKIIGHSPTKRFVCFNDLLGEGAFKKVYRAYDTTQGLEVAWNAIKVAGMSPSARQRVVQEMKILQTMDHPSIIHFFASFLSKETESVVFITEMMASGTLKDFIKIRPVRLRIVKRWCRHILHALVYLHDHDPPIIHRDLKCDNIFINGSTGDIRIGDLGLASWQRNGAAKSVLGTPEYMAPEMFEEHYDEQVDIYAFGMCVLEMITKETPFMECSTTPQIYKKVMAGIVPDSFNRLVDSPTKEFIYSCIRMPGENERRPSANELRQSEYLIKKENDPEDDIDCSELLKNTVVTERRPAADSFSHASDSMDVPTKDEETVPQPRNRSRNSTGSIPSSTRQSRVLQQLQVDTQPSAADAGVSNRENWEVEKRNSHIPKSPGESKSIINVPVVEKTDTNGQCEIGIGAVVRSRFGGGDKWFAGRISDIKDDGTYRINYDDADYEDGVAADMIEVLVAGQYHSLKSILVSDTKMNKQVGSTEGAHQELSVGESFVAESEPSSNGIDVAKPVPIDRQSTGEMASANVTKECRWFLIGEGTDNKQLLKVRFTQRDAETKMKQTAQFEFNFVEDTAAQLAKELCDEMNLSHTDLDNLVMCLIQLKHKYNIYASQHESSNEFRLEQNCNTYLADDSEASKGAKDDKASSPTDLHLQIQLEEEKYKKIMEEHNRTIQQLQQKLYKQQNEVVDDSDVSKEQDLEQKRLKAKESLKLQKKREAEEAEKKLLSSDIIIEDVGKVDATTLKQKMLYGTHTRLPQGPGATPNQSQGSVVLTNSDGTTM